MPGAGGDLAAAPAVRPAGTAASAARGRLAEGAARVHARRTRSAGSTAQPLERFCTATITSRPALRRELAAIRARGWSSSYEETNVGVWGIAVPVLSAADVVCAVGIAGPSPRLTAERVRQDVQPRPRGGHRHRPGARAHRAGGNGHRRRASARRKRPRKHVRGVRDDRHAAIGGQGRDRDRRGQGDRLRSSASTWRRTAPTSRWPGGTTTRCGPGPPNSTRSTRAATACRSAATSRTRTQVQAMVSAVMELRRHRHPGQQRGRDRPDRDARAGLPGRGVPADPRPERDRHVPAVQARDPAPDRPGRRPHREHRRDVRAARLPEPQRLLGRPSGRSGA